MSEPIIHPASETEEGASPLPPYEPIHINTVFLGGLFIFATLAACYTASSILLPIILAIILKFVLNPAMRLLQKAHIPSHVASLLVISVLFGGIYALGSVLSTPASDWAQQLPGTITKIQHQLHTITTPLKATQTVVQNAEILTQTTTTKPVTVTIQGSSFSDRLLTNTQSLARGVGETFLVLYFLLASGDVFLRRLTEILPRFHDKRQAVLITQQIESDISAYLAAITLMNALVGIATGAIMSLYGLGDPILWGFMAFMLNYIPVLGPFIGITLFILVGISSQTTLYAALLPATIYLLVHITESTFLTPRVLAKRFTLNPVLIILALIFWYWMWGVPGAILATPLLAITKIICDRIESLRPVGHFMEG